MSTEDKSALIQSVWQCIGQACELDSDDSDKETILLGLANLGERVCKLPTRRCKRKWVKEYRKHRADRGSFSFLCKELLVHDEENFRNYIRMSKSNFDFLLSLIKDDIHRKDTPMRAAIPPEEKLAMTLRFLATGESYISLDYQTRLSKAAIVKIVPEVCSALFLRLKSTYLKFPNNHLEWEAIAKEFAIRWQFPNCIGALDGKHINFRPSHKDGAYYYNYKGMNSIILLALVDANCKFIYIDVGSNGRCNDAGVFLQSTLNDTLQEETKLPPASSIGNGRNLPYVIVDDDAFPLQKHLMKPYPYHSHCGEKQIFNKRLSRARHVVEHAFGILASRFRVFLAPMTQNVETVEKITLACCVLHNYLTEEGETLADSFETVQVASILNYDVSDIPYNPRRGEAENIRRQYLEYFNREGKLDWLNPN